MGCIVMCEHGVIEPSPCSECEAIMAQFQVRAMAERAVIEAARRVADSWRGDRTGLSPKLTALVEALDSLSECW